MLQPLQLTEVSSRYAEEIAELRDFLVKADCPVGTGRALGQIADRLHQDRAFHRDLTSYVWVVIDRRNRISYSDLLGVLAIAAAGSSLAATADEDDAHRLLRFLMEARHSLDGISEDTDRTVEHATGAAVPDPVIGPGRSVRRWNSAAPEQSEQRVLLSPTDAKSGGRDGRRLPWIIAAACVLVVVLGALWLTRRPTEYGGRKSASANSAVPRNAVSESDTQQVVTPSDAPPAGRDDMPVPHSPMRRSNPPARALNTARKSSRRTRVDALPIPPSYHAPSGSVTSSGTSAASLPAPTPLARPSNSSPPPVPARPASGTVAPSQGGAPAVARTGPLGTPPVQQNSAQQDSGSLSRNSGAPILLRRRQAGSSPADSDDGATVASGGSAPVVSAAPGNSNGSAGTAHGGVVHATSLGAMASNLVYSPMPAYPAAAFASHVQGEVKVSADVDRDGHVASVRVISGPPLLRDAALDAVQRWRYRPYLSSNGPIRMAAIEILEFQLP